MNAPVTYIPTFIERPEAWFGALWTELAWERRPDAPRFEYWTNSYNRPYTYGRGAGRRTYEAQPDHPLIVRARNLLLEKHNVFLEGCFLNGYRDGKDSLGWHADDDPGIDHKRPIAVVTLGQPRMIQFKPIAAEDGESLMLGNGSLLLMHAGMQQTHLHRIPKAGFAAKPRVSLTFRGLFAQPVTP